MTSEARGFPSYNIEDNLFSSIFEHDKLVSKYRSAPPVIPTSTDVLSSTNTLQQFASNTEGLEIQENQRNIVDYQKSAVIFPRYKICIDGVDKVAEASILKSSFIVYRIRFSRTSDLQSHATWKRFKEISTWFQDLQQKEPDLAASSAKFPSAGDSWIGGNSSDPTSEFVQKRKFELEVFLKTLFSEFPVLVRHPSVIGFFELGKLPVETMSVVATRIAARDLQQQTNSRPSGHQAVYDKNHISNSYSTGGNENENGVRQDTSWYTYDTSVMQKILSREVAYDESSARMVTKNETDSNGKENSGNGNKTLSVVEILTFTDELGRMQRVGKPK